MSRSPRLPFDVPFRLKAMGVLVALIALLAGGLPAAAVANVPTAGQPTVANTASEVTSSSIRPMTLAGFTPGNIISDGVFFNSGSMTEAQIQAFLESRVASCVSGYTCLRNFRQTTPTRDATPMCGGRYAGASDELASRIIFKVAQACGINPQVLIVMLQKEQALVTHRDPSDWRYRIAMGQGCPDTAACDTRYYGFFNQVYGAASQMKRYANPPGTSNFFTWYAPGKTWNIGFNPNAACGSSPVYIQNQATANLYYYTPYQPSRAALAAGYGEASGGCHAYGNRNFYNYFTDWFGSTQGASSANDPFGNFESVSVSPGQIRVTGWAIDPETSASLEVHVYLGKTGYPAAAGLARPDVGAAYPSKGSAHGFDVTMPANGGGLVEVCVYAINVGAGEHGVLGCKSVNAMSGSPMGQIDTLEKVEGGVSIRGWALDPDTADAIEVHAYIDGRGVATLAANARPDLAAHYPAYGGAHGYQVTVPASAGDRTLCLYAINRGAGLNTTLMCRSLTVPGPPDANIVPKGNYESLSLDGNTAVVTGWALDPDTTSPIQVHVYVNSVGTAVLANLARKDLAQAFPLFTGANGFSASVTLPAGRSQVCAYAINTSGENMNLGCRVAEVATPGIEMGRAPVGNFELASASERSIRVSGWALDKDTTDPIPVHVYIDGVGHVTTASTSRGDVGAAYPGLGDLHGFEAVLPTTTGAHSVCAWAINSGPGPHTSLGCRNVTVP